MGSGRRCRSTGGFTLLELLVVLVILGVITAVAAPNVGVVLRRLSPERPGEQLAAVLQVARSEAVRRGQTACFELDVRSGVYRITLLFASGDSVVSAGQLQPWVGGNATGALVCFYPSGVATPGWRLWVGDDHSVLVELDPWDGKVSVVR